ncbi:MAG: TfoX/Sxy family protein [Firmicutes bacterium]|nr:TfoX/Sxy family protein [uncultured Acetobacterium sp.]MBU4440338.1 TfoX/Sxy family protein [Bacillota bacterium]
MASSQEFVDYVCDQISGAGVITSRKMFGEYGIYCNGKIIGLICDNQFFVKKTSGGGALLIDPEEAPPYDGAKPMFVISDLEDRDFLTAFILKSYEELPMQKARKKKVKE